MIFFPAIAFFLIVNEQNIGIKTEFYQGINKVSLNLDPAVKIRSC